MNEAQTAAVIGAAWLACVAVGFYLGGLKARPWAGAILGLALGPVGWLITGALPSLKPRCPFCRSLLNDGAVKCHRCGSFVRAAS